MAIFREKTNLIPFSAVLALLVFYFFFLSPPKNFPVDSVVRIEPGMSLKAISTKLKAERVIRSRVLFEALVIIYGGERSAVSTNYFFERKLPVSEVARRIAQGRSHLAQLKVTIPEGFTNREIAELFAERFLNFNLQRFLEHTQELEGYLFPDTYFFFPHATEDEILGLLRANFEAKLAPLRAEIVARGKTLAEVIIMASIIEKEAKGDGDRGIISGILWKRLELDRALEVDTEPETYKTKGLPARPIANPGLDSIRAAVFPEESPYLYYLHDPSGQIHYGRTFEEHKKNKALYLRR